MNNSTGRKRSSKKYPTKTFYQADFETTTDAEDCRVWAWGLGKLPCTVEQVEIGTDVADFLERIDAENSVIFFHNLKFDGHFLISHFLVNDYVWVDERHPKPGEFTTLISDMGKFYSMNVTLPSGCKIEFRDSNKKLPMSVERIAHAFKLETLKGDLDYHAERPVGHRATAEERKYIAHDIVIPANALAQQMEQGMTRLTVGSDSLAEYKRTVGEKYFQRHFPVLPLDMDLELRRAYRGGFTYSDPRYKGRRVGSGKVYDVNSLYPAVMYNESLPYGEPQWAEGRVEPTDSHPLTIFSVTLTATLKKDHIPCIQIKGASLFIPTEYQTEIVEPTTLMMTNVDFDLYSRHYDLNVLAWGGGWRFRAKTGMFRAYIDKWSKIKSESTGGLREISKLHLNSLYGKFASNPSVTSKYPVLQDGRVVYKRGEDETRDPVYTAMGVFITAYARALTINAAQTYYPVFAYADTDSLHLMMEDEPEHLDIHPTRMGAWKHEYDFHEAFYIRAKAYLELVDYSAPPLANVYVNRIAGLPERISEALTLDDVVDGKVIEGKLTPKSVPGGIVLVDTPFKLKL